MWPAIHTRPDIAYAVSTLAKYSSNPGTEHRKSVEKIFRYIKGTLNYGLTFKADKADDMISYSDSDFTGLIDGRKSTRAFTFILAGAPIAH